MEDDSPPTMDEMEEDPQPRATASYSDLVQPCKSKMPYTHLLHAGCVAFFQPSSDQSQLQGERFRLKSKTFVADIQYAQLYYVRALLMNKRLADTIQRAWPNTQSRPPSY